MLPEHTPTLARFGLHREASVGVIFNRPGQRERQSGIAVNANLPQLPV